MKSTKLSSLLNAALGLTLGTVPFLAHAAALNVNDTLTITTGVKNAGTQTTTGSWFAMDNGDGIIVYSEKTMLRQGTTGLVIGVTTTAGASHSGVPNYAVDTNAITRPWSYFGNTGSDYVTTAVTGSTGAGLNMASWTVTWNAIPAIPMGVLRTTPVDPADPASVDANTAWNTGFTSGVGNFVWDGVYGHTYTLDYRANVPLGDASGFGGVGYALHLEGTVVNGVLASMTSPVGTAVDAAATNTIVVTFPEPVTGVGTGYISINGGAVSVNSVSVNGNVYTFNIGALANGTTYTVVFNNAGVAAVSGTPLAIVPNASFTTSTPDTTPPTVIATTPAAAASVPTNTSTIVVTFSEAMNVSTVTPSALTTSPAITVNNVNASNGDKTFTFNISGLVASTDYTVSVNAQAKDVAGNSVAGNSLSFRTLSGANPVLTKNTNDQLLICPGSKFGMEVSAGNTIFTSITQHNPITIGVLQAGGGSHSGAPNGSETLAIDNGWSFFGNTGLHYTATTAVTDYGNGTLNFSGWRVHWNGLSIPMGSGLPATFTWDGVYGHSYTLSYLANVPNGDPSGFGGVLYSLSLTGKVNGGPSNVNAACDGATVSPSGVLIAVSGVAGATVALNSQILPDDPKLVEAGYSAAGRPDGYNFYKYGAITYTVSGLTPGAGQTATVTLTLPENVPAGSKIYKINSTGYHDITSQVTISGATLTLNILDDGPLDDCVGCTALVGNVLKAVIVDPIVVGVPLGTSGNATGAATGGSGGCAYNPNGKFDLGMLLALFGSLGYLGWRRTR